MTAIERIERTLAEADKYCNECGTLATTATDLAAECFAIVKSGRPARLMLSKFERLKDCRRRMDRLIEKAKAKLSKVDVLVKAAEIAPDKAAEFSESTQSFLVVLDGLHRMVSKC